MMIQLKWPRLCGPLIFTTIIVIILTQLHLTISAPTSTVSAPADDVTDYSTLSWQHSDDVTERRLTVPGNGEVSQSVRSNALDSASKNRQRRQLYASQGCGPVCNRCRQVMSLRYSALCLLECEAGFSGTSSGRHYDFCLVVLEDPPPGLVPQH